MIGIAITFGVAVFSGARARQAHLKGRQHLLQYAITTAVFSVVGGYIDVVSNIWRALGIVAGGSTGQSFALYLLGYAVAALYLMFAVYYGRIIPFTFRASR